MTAQIIDFAQKKRERRAREFLETDVTSLSPEELKSLQISLRNIIITEAGENNIYPGDGYTTVMINGMGYHIPDIDLEDYNDVVTIKNIVSSNNSNPNLSSFNISGYNGPYTLVSATTPTSIADE